ncbi:MAG: ABC transporter permease [Oscillospiraceae bacterium]|nr:ABC transporter permease [Oscillospiraceae bacterium]
MRLLHLTYGDIRFQYKYGFYFVYAVFTALYLMVLAVVPESARRAVAAALIFSDPAAMGLFFMGAIVLLEKSQRINGALAVSPVRIFEYCFGKLFSIALIGLIAGLVLAVAGGVPDLFLCIIALILSSFICSALGLIAAMKSTSLNRFVLAAVPFELLIFVPPILLLLNISHPLLSLHPGVAAVRLMAGIEPDPAVSILCLIFWAVTAVALCVRTVKKDFLSTGGFRL